MKWRPALVRSWLRAQLAGRCALFARQRRPLPLPLPTPAHAHCNAHTLVHAPCACAVPCRGSTFTARIPTLSKPFYRLGALCHRTRSIGSSLRIKTRTRARARMRPRRCPRRSEAEVLGSWRPQWPSSCGCSPGSASTLPVKEGARCQYRAEFTELSV